MYRGMRPRGERRRCPVADVQTHREDLARSDPPGRLKCASTAPKIAHCDAAASPAARIILDVLGASLLDGKCVEKETKARCAPAATAGKQRAARRGVDAHLWRREPARPFAAPAARRRRRAAARTTRASLRPTCCTSVAAARRRPLGPRRSASTAARCARCARPTCAASLASTWRHGTRCRRRSSTRGPRGCRRPRWRALAATCGVPGRYAPRQRCAHERCRPRRRAAPARLACAADGALSPGRRRARRPRRLAVQPVVAE